MLGLKTLYQAVLGKKTRIEDVPGFENAYLFENRMSSMNAGEQHEYFQRFDKPAFGIDESRAGTKHSQFLDGCHKITSLRIVLKDGKCVTLRYSTIAG